MDLTNKLACILRAIPVGIIICDIEKPLYLNEKSRELLGEYNSMNTSKFDKKFEKLFSPILNNESQLLASTI